MKGGGAAIGNFDASHDSRGWPPARKLLMLAARL